MSVKDTVLKFLEENKGTAVSGQTIADAAGASRAAVWKAITQLREEGHIIPASTNKGYTLSSTSDLLSSEGIHSFCKALPIENIHCFKTTESTNTVAKQIANEGASETALVVSEAQLNGRGRMGRSFFSPDSYGIYMSLLIKPKFNISKSILVTTAASVAVCRAIRSVLGIECQIKWVNDIFLDGRKIGGILTEGITSFESGQVEYIVIGIGINYSTPSEAFPENIKDTAGSLIKKEAPGAGALNFVKSRNQLIGTIVSELTGLLDSLNFEDFLDEYKSRSLVIGHEVLLSNWGGADISVISGKAIDINNDGALVILLEDGSTKIINSGEVTLRRADKSYK